MDVRPLEGKSLLALRNPSSSIEAYEGAVRSGKTITSLLDWVKFTRQGPVGSLAMCGRTERTVINNLIIPLQEMMGRSRVQIKYGTGTVTILGREINIYGANNEQARTKIQGLTLAGAYVDEGAELPQSFVQMLYSRLSVPGAKLWLTSNPGSPAHWLKTDWLDKAKLWIDGSGRIIRNDSPDAMDLHRYTFLLDDNPSLTEEYVERTKRSYTGLFRRRYVNAEWVAADGAIFDGWNPDVHVLEPEDLPPMIRYISVGADYGTRNASAAILLGIGQDGKLYAVDEFRYDSKAAERVLTEQEIAVRFEAWVAEHEAAGRRPEWVAVDPAALSFRVELGNLGRHNVMQANNDVLYGIRIMASLLSTGALKVSSACDALIKEMPAYAWDSKESEKGIDKPIKVADHSIDSFRYALISTETLWRPYIDTPIGG
ncbi:MAG: PBSX family phage terminase large subunit [Bifidobacterium mongoliense]|nr:PBSX family phage terminase large subunit [Bifidobacterium mongoliense]MDN6720588.1 PBSX family phage terminase large subunit [Bifidobacterium mongoliense]